MASSPGLIPGGGNYSGLSVNLPFAPQTGGQASLGGNINPLLPINTSTSTSMPMMPQGAVSNSASTGLPAPMPTATNTGGTTFGANTPGGIPQPVVPGGSPGIVAPPNNPGAGQTGISGISAGGFGFPTTKEGQHQLWHGLSTRFGPGIATALMNFLSSGAGFNQDAINNLIAGLQPGFERANQNLMQQFSAGGNRFGSGAEVGAADLASQQQLQVGELETQMYEQAVQNYMSILGLAAGTPSKPSGLFSDIEGALGLAGNVGSALQDAGVGGGGGAGGAIVGMLAGLA